MQCDLCGDGEADSGVAFVEDGVGLETKTGRKEFNAEDAEFAEAQRT